MEDAIRQPDLSRSVQRYQRTADEAKVRLNLAVCPGAWLMPVRMIINTKSMVGYNKLKQAVAGMKLGVNNEVNLGTIKAALKLMAGGPSKINQPKSHPSNPIHKAAMATQTGKPQQEKEEPTSDQGLQKVEPVQSDETPQHKQNNLHHWCGKPRGVAVFGTVLTQLLDYFSSGSEARFARLETQPLALPF